METEAGQGSSRYASWLAYLLREADRRSFNALLHIITFTIVGSTYPCSAQLSDGDLRWRPDEFVVTVRPGSFSAQPLSNGPSISAHFGSWLGDPSTRIVRRVGSFASAASTQTSLDSEFVPFNGDQGFCKALIAADPSIASCEPNFELKAARLPDDPQLSSLWGMNVAQGIDAPGGWEVATGNESIVVAVIDTGIDYNHPDLRANVWVNPGEIAANGVDDDGNGYVDDIHGINAITGSGDPMDDNGHGTHVSGTIGASGNDARGIAGVNWRVRFMGLKFLGSGGGGALSDGIKAINYAVMMVKAGVKIRVSNNSWGGGGYSQALHDAIQRLSDAGVVFVAAAGNEANDNDLQPAYPGSYPVENLVSVAAVDQNRNLASFSNFGAQAVDIAAPGVGILSTVPGGGYSSLSGTSMAAPHVTGALTLLLSHEPDLSSAEAVQRLYETALPLAQMAGVVSTGRMLNLRRLMHNTRTELPPPPPVIPPCDYAMASIPYDPDLSADGTPVRQQADEGNFLLVPMQHTFPFFNNSLAAMVASPNAALYEQAPVAIDYQNYPKAAPKSINALHSDFVSDLDGAGLRYASSATGTTIYWKAKHYQARSGGFVHIRTTLFPDGRIRIFVHMEDELVAQAVRAQSSIGIAGPTQAFPYAYNQADLPLQFGVEFVPQCGAGEDPPGVNQPVVTKIGVTSPSGAKHGRSITPGKAAKVMLQGTGSGAVAVSAVLDGVQCGSSLTGSLAAGKGTLRVTIPRAVRRSLKLISGTASRVVRFKSGVRVNVDRALRACDQMIRSSRHTHR